jgi:hypothetical protein
LRRACARAPLAPIQQLLTVPLPPGGSDDQNLANAAARIEGQIRIKQEPLELTALIRRVSGRPDWRYGRWVGLFGLATSNPVVVDATLAAIDEHLDLFGGSSEVYSDLARFSPDDDLYNRIVNRMLGDLAAHPHAGDLWIAFALCIGSGPRSIAARDEVWQRLRAQCAD